MKQSEELMQEEIDFIKEYRSLLKKANGGKLKKTSNKYIADKDISARLRKFKVTLALTMAGLTVAAVDARVGDKKNERDVCTFVSIVANSEQQNPIIVIDGKEIELDMCSIAMVKGEIKDGENSALAYDQSGTQVEVNINSQNLRGAIEIPKDKMDDYLLYRVVAEGAELLQTGEEVLNVSYGDFVIGEEQHEGTVNVIYPNQEGMIEGQIDRENLEIVNEVYIDKYQNNQLSKYVVNTEKDSYGELNFRSDTNEDKYSIMMQIPNGTIVTGTGQTKVDNGREWTQIEYEGQIGWGATEYLERVILQGKEGEIDKKQEYIENPKIENMSGEVTAIDVSQMTGKQLEQLIDKGIPLEVSTKDSGDINTTSVAGKINAVQIKLAASPHGKGEFKTIYNEACEELIRVCEEKKIPYGLYFYTTATNEEQAEIEAKYVNEMVKELRQKYDMKYDIVPFTYDFEIAGPGDVHLGHSIEDISKAKAHLINKTEISDEIILYTAGRLIKNPKDTVQKYADTLLDLGIVKEELKNPEKLSIWLCAPKDRNGNTTQETIEYCEMIEKEYGFKVVSQQVVLDAYSPTGGWMDINSLRKKFYDQIDSKKKEIELELEQSTENESTTAIEETEEIGITEGTIESTAGYEIGD